MKRTTLGLIAGVAIALLLVGFVPRAQSAGPAGMKLYAFSSGGLTIAKSALQSEGCSFHAALLGSPMPRLSLTEHTMKSTNATSSWSGC